MTSFPILPVYETQIVTSGMYMKYITIVQSVFKWWAYNKEAQVNY